MATLAGTRLDKYDLIEEVGHGGMAVVYRGLDTMLDREVAVKILHAHLADREESRARLRREAITVAKLHHDHIVEIFDYSGPEADESYIVTEFIHGDTLRDWLDTRWKPHPVVAALIVHRLCLPLEHAHDLGIVHRDIKPENVMIRRDGCLKLMDFGIAQILDHQKLTMTGQLLGSPAYMAPELISGKPVDKRTDLFAVGIMLYQLATGRLPFSGRNPHEVLNRIADGEYDRPSVLCQRVDEDLEAIIDKALAREPNQRYQSSRSLANDLEDYLGKLGVEASPAALQAYFEETESFVDELDQKIVANVLDRAQAATRDGNTARALKLLGQVLEIEPENTKARSMLDAARVRGERMRMLLMAGGALALIGLVAAAFLLMKPDPPKPAAIDGDEVEVAHPDRDGPTVPTKPAGETGDGPEADTGAEAANETEGATGGPAADTSGRPDTPVKPIPARLTSRDCTIKVTNVPAAGLSNRAYKVAAHGKTWPVTPNGLATVKLPSKGPDVRAELRGPRWEGTTGVLTTEKCKKTALLEARAKPAELVFSGLPPGATVECQGKLCLNKKPQLPGKFSKIPLPGQGPWKVQLIFRATGYSAKDEARILEPGVNRVKVQMDLN